MSNVDPFADDYVADETEKNETEEIKVEAPQVNNSSPEISVTLKGGRDFDSPWVVVRANSTTEALAALDEDMQELLKQAAKYGKAFATLVGGDKPSGSSGGGGRGTRQAPGPKEHPTGREEFCKHGKMEYKTGTSAKGNNYKLFSCTGPRDEQCKAVYDND